MKRVKTWGKRFNDVVGEPPGQAETAARRLLQPCHSDAKAGQ